MAVAKAQGQGGFSAIHIWLVAFVGLWLTATVLLVILYLDQDKKESAVNDMRDQLAKVISSEGRKLPEFTKASPSRGSTMVDLLESARAESAEIAVGADDLDVPAMRAKLNDQLEKIRAKFVESADLFEGVSYAGALASLYDMSKQYAEELEEVRTEAEARAEEMIQLRADQAKQKEDFDAQALEMKETLATLEKDNTEFQQTHREQVDAFGEEVERIKQQCSDDIQAQRSENARMGRDYKELFARYQQLKEKLGQSQVAPLLLATARRMDGTILKAIPGDDDVVYIDLGARDHLTLGLEFAVYDVLEGIPEDGRAKARIEVVRIDEKTAVCRVEERLSHEMIVSGDIIANPIYDKHRTIRFYVMGEFDTNNDGRPDRAGQEQVRASIEHWGGVVESDLTAQVDFVVLGASPRKPVRSSEYDVNSDDKYAARMRVYDAYQSKLKTADALAVPRLTQSVLLSFLGYDSAQVADFGAGGGSSPPF